MTGLQLVRAVLVSVALWVVLAVLAVAAVVVITALSGWMVDLVARVIVAG